MSKDLDRLHDEARGKLIEKRDQLIKTKESDSVLKKTRKTISQLDWGVEQYADELDNMMSRNASADDIRSYIRKIEEKALKDFQLLDDDSVHHKVQSRTGGDTLSNAKSRDIRNVVKRLEQKYSIKFGNSSGPGGNLTADSSLSNFAHKSDDRARGLERASGIGKNPNKATTAHAKGTAGYAKNLKPSDIVNEQSLYAALDERVGAQIKDYQTGVKTDQPRQQAIRALTNDPLAYSPDATDVDVANTRQKILTTDPAEVRKTYLKLTGGKALFSQGVGGIMGFLTNQEATTKLGQGDIKGAIEAGGKDFLVGETVSQVAQRFVLPQVSKVAPKLLNGVMKFSPPLVIASTAVAALDGATRLGNDGKGLVETGKEAEVERQQTIEKDGMTSARRQFRRSTK